MIFVTVGTHVQGFDRLIKEVDSLLMRGEIKEKVVMQIGNTGYEPANSEFFRFLDSNEKIMDYVRKSEMIITHGGAGSIINSLSSGKPTIVVPRYKRFGEHVNDHQLELAKSLEKEGKIISVYNITNLAEAIERARGFKARKVRNKSGIIDAIEIFLERYEKQNKK